MTLECVVDEHCQSEAAEAAVRGLAGVVCVVNALGLTPDAQAKRAQTVRNELTVQFEAVD